jgi:hypothetical protein
MIENNSADDSIVFAPAFDAFLGIKPRARRGWLAKGLLPPPDGNVQGRPFWLLATFQRFKSEVIAGRFASEKRLPGMSAESAA